MKIEMRNHVTEADGVIDKFYLEKLTIGQISEQKNVSGAAIVEYLAKHAVIFRGVENAIVARAHIEDVNTVNIGMFNEKIEKAEKAEKEKAEKEKGVKYDDKKPRWDLLPLELVEGIVKVLTFGAQKYQDDNWQHVDNAEKRYFAALMRHLTAYQSGETVDDEFGLSHLDHAACNLIFLRYFEKNKNKS